MGWYTIHSKFCLVGTTYDDSLTDLILGSFEHTHLTCFTARQEEEAREKAEAKEAKKKAEAEAKAKKKEVSYSLLLSNLCK